MNLSKGGWILWAGVLATAGFSAFSLSYRYRIEARNRAVELAVEMDVVEALTRGEGMGPVSSLKQLKAAGTGAVVLSEESIGDLEKAGRLRIFRPSRTEIPTADGKPRAEMPSSYDHIIEFEVDLGSRLRQGLAARGVMSVPATAEPQSGRNYVDVSHSQNRLVVHSVTRELLQTVTVGIDSEKARFAKGIGLRVIARASNPMGSRSDYAQATLAELASSGADVFLPQGDQVLGRRDGLDNLKKGLAETAMQYASPEFARIGGDLNAVNKAPERVVRLHSAQAAELDKMTESDAVERYVRAGRERNIRVLLLRPLTFTAEKPLTSFAGFIQAVANRLRKEGGAVGTAKPFEAPAVPQWVFPMIGISAAMVVWQTAGLLFNRKWLVGLIGAGAALAGFAAWMPEFRNYSALLAALALPVAAFLMFCSAPGTPLLKGLAGITAVSLVGGMAVAGLLNDLPYFIRGDQFAGVKIAHFLPVLVVGVFLASQLFDWRGGLQSPITWLQACLSILILVGLAFMFARTGNDNPAAVSGIELKLRSLLDNILPVRPRTKEFMLGYPALVIGLGLLGLVRSGGPQFRPLAGWAVLALMVGAIAPTSVVNTMCHLHTPLEVGLLRIAVGFVVGGIIGAAAWSVLRLWLPKPGT